MMRNLLRLAPFAFVIPLAEALADHAWLYAAPLLVLLAVGLVLIAPGDETPAASEASPRPASASHPQREEAALGDRGAP